MDPCILGFDSQAIRRYDKDSIRRVILNHERSVIGWLYSRIRVGSEGWEVFEVCRKMFLVGVLVWFDMAWRAPRLPAAIFGFFYTSMCQPSNPSERP